MQNSSCENEFYLNKNKNRFHTNGFALSLVLKQRLKATRKCSICFRKRFNRWLFERQPVDWWLALMKGWHSNLQLWISLRTEVFFINLVEQIDFFLPSPPSIFFFYSSFCCVFRFLFKEIYIKSLVPKGGKRFCSYQLRWPPWRQVFNVSERERN